MSKWKRAVSRCESMNVKSLGRAVTLLSQLYYPNAVRAMCEEMKTTVLKLSSNTANNGPLVQAAEKHGQLNNMMQHHDGDRVLHSTVKALQEGLVVAVPTDTLYGLACLAQNSEAVKRVYDIKGRNGNKPLAICVGEVQDIYKYCKVVVQKELLEDLLPGPVTLVLERSETLNADLNPFTNLVGVRIPDHSFMRRLCQLCDEPLALTSANVSAQTSTVAVHEFEELWSRLAVVVDGGTMADQSRLGSTVIDLSVPGRYRVIRPGCACSATVAVLQNKYALLEDSSSS